jgi:predicted transcriptional regulator
MRTTIRLDDDLARALKEQAQRERLSFASAVNRAIRQGLSKSKSQPKRKKFRQRTYNMGVPLVDLTKASALAAALEDEEIIAKLALGK